MLNICVIGACGRMGQLLVEAAQGAEDLCLVGAVEAPGHPRLDQPVAPGCDVLVTDREEEAVQKAEVLVDFSSAAHTPSLLATARSCRKAVVCGVTGLDDSAQKQLEEAAREIPLFYSVNMSLGVAVLARAVAFVAKSLGDDFDIEVQDIHHARKKDAPSGTALMLGETAAHARGWPVPESFCLERTSSPGARLHQQIGFSALRGGGASGVHHVYFLGGQEVVTLSHESFSRAVFVDGALKAARWLAGRKAGLYGMQDLLGEVAF